MNKSLPRAHGAGDGVVVVVADTKNPGVVSCSRERSGGCAGSGVRGLGRTDRARSAGAGRIGAREADDSHGRNDAMRQIGCHCYAALRGAGEGAPDFRCAALLVGTQDQGPRQTAAGHAGDCGVGARGEIGGNESEKQFVGRGR